MAGDYIRGFNTGLGTYQETNWLVLKRTGYSSLGLGQCLRVVAAAALLLELAFKLSLGQKLLCVPLLK